MEVQQRTAAELYLDLLKKCLTRYLFGESYVPAVPPRGTLKHTAFEPVRRWLAGKDMEVIRHVPFDQQGRAEGRDWPARAESMAGLKRLDNLLFCVTDVLRRGVPGDLIETGAWRGGVTIFMRAILEAYGDPDRRVWVADSFQGLPKPDPERWPAEAGDEHWAVLRLDGDMYGSTMEALDALYPKLSQGGYVIVDDYGAIPQCKEAVTDFRTAHGIIDPMEPVDWTGVYWQRS